MMTKSTGSRDKSAREKISLDQLKATLSLEDEVRRAGVKLVRATGGMKGCCPFHDERTPSFYVFSDHAHCFSCGFHGDVLDFMARNENLELSEVIGREIRIYQGLDPAARPAVVRTKQERNAQREQPGTPRIPAPEGFNSLFRPNQKPDDQGRVWTNEILNPNNVDKPISRLPVDMCHEYRLANGDLYGYVVRTPRFGKDAKKITPAVMWLDGVTMPDGSKRDGWCYTSFPYPRPIYGLYALGQHSEEGGKKRVIVVEGEKCVDKSINLLREMGWAVVSWCGGTSVPHRTDWSPLAGWDVVLWPDADESGAGAMAEMAHLIQQVGAASVMVVPPPAAAPKKWDIADAIEPKADAPDGWRTPWDAERLSQHLETAIPARTYLEMNGLAQPPDADDEQDVQAEGIEVIDDGALNVRSILELTGQDEGTPYQQQVLEYAADLSERDEAEFARLEGGFRRAGVSMRQWKRALQRVQTEKAQKAHGVVLPTDGDGVNEARQSIIDASGARLRPLGYDRDIYYYYSTLTKQLVPLSADKHNAAHLCRLAPLEFWAAAFPKGNDRLAVNWQAANNHLMQRCHEKGIFQQEDTVRNFGLWYEQMTDRYVLNFGDWCVINDKDGNVEHCGLDDIVSRYIYERCASHFPTHIYASWDDVPAMTNEDGIRFLRFASMMQWERPYDGLLYAGWCALSHVVGVLPWRPHIWVTGPRGTGKSTLLAGLRTICGPWALAAQGASTEAGLRQSLDNRAVPILFDEIEGDSERARNRIDTIIEMIRQASTGDNRNGANSGFGVRKGNKDGQATTYELNTMFALGSIGVILTQDADLRRITVLQLQTPPAKSDKEAHQARRHYFNNTIIPEYSHWVDAKNQWAIRMMKRMVERVRDLDATIKVLKLATSDVLDTEQGDQIGTLLAGAWMLASDQPPTRQQADQWLKDIGIAYAAAELVNDSSDEEKCLAQILSLPIPVDAISVSTEEVILEGEAVGAKNRTTRRQVRVAERRTIGQLLGYAFEADVDQAFAHIGALEHQTIIDKDAAVAALRRVGIIVGFDEDERTLLMSKDVGIENPDDYVLIATSSDVLQQGLVDRKAKWATESQWGRLLRRLPGKVSVNKNHRYRGYGAQSKPVAIPLSLIFPDGIEKSTASKIAGELEGYSQENIAA